MSDTYVKEFEGGKWMVKLGAGLLPFVITQHDLDWAELLYSSTFVCGPGGIEGAIRHAQGIAAVKKYLAEKGLP